MGNVTDVGHWLLEAPGLSCYQLGAYGVAPNSQLTHTRKFDEVIRQPDENFLTIVKVNVMTHVATPYSN